MVKHLSDDQLQAPAAAAATTRSRSTPPTRPRSSTRASRRSSSPAPSRATASAKPAKARTSPTSRRSSTKKSCARSATRFGIPISDDEIADAPFYRPADDSPEMQYLRERRKALGGFVPVAHGDGQAARDAVRGSCSTSSTRARPDREVSTTMVVRAAAVEAAAGQGDRRAGRADRAGRGAHLRHGVAVPRSRHLLARRPALRAGRHGHAPLLQGGARTARSSKRASPRRARMSSFIAAGTAYATHGVNTIPFFIYYSMFGFQRVGDLIWAAADSRARGLPARRHRRPDHARTAKACSTRTATATSARCAVPNCVSYDPAFAYELAVIIQDGIRRMYEEQRDIFYYITRHQRELPDAADARGLARRHPQGHVQAPRRREPQGEAARPAARQRRDPQRGAGGAGAARRELRRGRRRVERHQLPGALSRRRTPATAGTCCIPASRRRSPT